MQHQEVQQARYGKGRTYLQMCVSSYLPCSTSLHSLADERRHPAFGTSKLAWRYRPSGGRAIIQMRRRAVEVLTATPTDLP